MSDDTGGGGSSSDVPTKAALKRKVKGKLHIQFELPLGSLTDEEITAQVREVSSNFRFILIFDIVEF